MICRMPNFARLRTLTIFAALSVAPAMAGEARQRAPSEPVDFSSQIRPIISSKCFSCHGPDESSRKAKLRLDIREEAVKERKGVRALVPGDLENSEMVRRITATDPDDVMPPPKSGRTLTVAEIDLIKRWIQQGALYTPHWAFVKPERPSLPKVKTKSWPRNAIDSFILAELEKHRLKPSPPADRYTLIRRLSLDLTGLPPTPREVDDFVNDPRGDAYERLVDRLLGSPAYGERWARVWLDLARYADSAGYGSDPLRLNIWPWRDWVIRALNDNMPYDRFTIEQIAGDLLPRDANSDDQDPIVATGFHRNTMTNTEGGTDDEEYRVAAVKDRANVTAQVWMGLTLGCAQCHTHKYDPVTQREYYQFYAFFNQTEDNDQPDERPTLPLPTREQREKMERLKSAIARLEKERKQTTPEFEAELVEWEKAQAKGIDWMALEPSDLTSYRGATLNKLSDHSILAAGDSPETDTYTVKVRTDLTNLTAVRLELLPHESLPKQGPGRAAGTGQAVLNEFQLAVRSPKTVQPAARFVRIELPGTQRVLSLAEIQVFDDRENVAPKGQASQSSTDSGADARRAIDTNTDGNFDAASTTMTRAEDNPWWELDLGTDTPLEEIAIWNRTDRGLGTRLADFKVLALDAQRKTLWERNISAVPGPVTRLRVPVEKEVRLQNASADYSGSGYAVSKAIDGSTDAKNGWSVGDKTGGAHVAAFEIEGKPIEEPGALLIFTLTQNHGTNHTLGHFRLSATTEPRPVRELPDTLKTILAVQPADRTEKQREELADYFREFAPSLATSDERLKKLRKELDDIKPVALPVLRELAAARRRESHILNKGNFLDPGEKVEPGVPAAFHPFPSDAPTNRVGLARWLMSRDNPLTARVAVNRLWAQLFGTGMVETEEDFGTQGALPSHRELLDWLAVEFMGPAAPVESLNRTTDESERDQNAQPFNASTLQRFDGAATGAWDIKRLLKLIVMSATYQQSSRVTPELLEKDPRNRLLSRGPRHRLDAETVRDQALALSGLLSRKIGGPSVYPWQPDGLWRAAFNGERTWATSKGEDKFRRGLYTFWRRTVPYPSMATFDAPSRETCTLRRIQTDTPLQAFVTLNDPVYVEASQALGRRLVREGGATVADRVRYGLRLCLARPPNEEQVKALVELYEKEAAHYRENETDAKKLATEPLGPLPENLSAAEAAAWTSVANVLLNLDGVLTKG